MAFGCIVALIGFGAAGRYGLSLPGAPSSASCGMGEAAPTRAARNWCECDGISEVISVTVSEPDSSPRSCSERPGPCPGCIGERPSRYGKANVDLAAPP